MRAFDAILRPTGTGARLGPAVVAVVLGGGGYGAVMGSFGGLAGDRGLQIVFSAVKVPLLLLLTTALALPSFFVLNTVLGLRRDWPTALRAVLGAQGAVAIVLAALAPYTALWYASSGNYHRATTFNGGMFLIAAVAAQWVLRQYYAPLVAGNRRHRTMMRGWLILYAFVAIQLGWVLRPFIGDPALPPTFFRAGAWGNAYVVVAEIVWKAFGGTVTWSQ